MIEIFLNTLRKRFKRSLEYYKKFPPSKLLKKSSSSCERKMKKWEKCRRFIEIFVALVSCLFFGVINTFSSSRFETSCEIILIFLFLFFSLRVEEYLGEKFTQPSNKFVYKNFIFFPFFVLIELIENENPHIKTILAITIFKDEYRKTFALALFDISF
jgi:hypothetical protein